MNKRINTNLMNAYIELRNKCEISTFKRFNVIILMHPKVFYELMGELPYGMQVDPELNCHFIELCGHKTPLLIERDLPENVEFQIMTQEDYERIEKEKLFTKFDKMFYQD